MNSNKFRLNVLSTAKAIVSSKVHNKINTDCNTPVSKMTIQKVLMSSNNVTRAQIVGNVKSVMLRIWSKICTPLPSPNKVNKTPI